MSLSNRYDFVLVFDVKDGNPNGDPDSGNLPRLDTESGQGLITDVSLKRKVRNFVGLAKKCEAPFDIYVKEKAVLGYAHKEAFSDLNIALGEETRISIPLEKLDAIQELILPEGLSIDENEEDHASLVVAADTDVKSVKASIKEMGLSKDLKSFLDGALKGVKTRRPNAEEVNRGRQWMCDRFYDIRTFGAVMALKSAPNCGQVRGPVQITFARSVDPIITLEHSITRMAVATEAEAEKQQQKSSRAITAPWAASTPFLTASTWHTVSFHLFSPSKLALAQKILNYCGSRLSICLNMTVLPRAARWQQGDCMFSSMTLSLGMHMRIHYSTVSRSSARKTPKWRVILKITK